MQPLLTPTREQAGRTRGTMQLRQVAWTAVTLLAMAVFAWGLHYKLSLYAQHAAPKAPAAKLLSQKERPAQVQLVRTNPRRPLHAAAQSGFVGLQAAGWNSRGSNARLGAVVTGCEWSCGHSAEQSAVRGRAPPMARAGSLSA